MVVPPTILSTFEVLFTPQLPTGIPVPSQVSSINEYVVKGYFLTISNPNAKPYLFRIGFHCNTNPASTVPERTLAKAIGFIDDGTTAIPATIAVSSVPTDFFVNVTVAATGTILLGVIPLFFGMAGLASPVIDCRGWADISLPPIFKKVGSGPFGILSSVPQSSNPVPIIVTPEQRLTFLPIPGDVPTAVEAQSAFALPVAGGSATLSVPPQPAISIFDNTKLGGLDTLSAGVASTIASASVNEQFALLSALVSASPAVTNGKRKAEDVMRDLGFGRE